MQASPMFAQIAVNSYTKDNHQLFTYLVPDHLEPKVKIGQLVLVPFGPRLLKGIVFGLDQSSEQTNLKPIYSLTKEKPVLQAWQIELINWMCEFYLASLPSVIQTVHPFLFTKPPALRPNYTISLIPNQPFPKRLGSKQQALLYILQKEGDLPQTRLTTDYQISASTIRSLIKHGLIQQKNHNRPSQAVSSFASTSHLTLTNEQQHVLSVLLDSKMNEWDVIPAQAGIQTIKPDKPNKTSKTSILKFSVHKNQTIQQPPSRRFLLHGVTGSGKTEVYLQLIASLLEQGKQAIVLVPEIILTPQTIERFAGRFPGQVAVWHSKLSKTERYQTFQQIQQGQIRIVIGSRSALFLPFNNLGLIVIDEEHEISYKQEQTPRYLARTVAEKINDLTGSILLLGSATPDVVSYYQATKGDYQLLELNQRVNLTAKATSINEANELPRVGIVDMSGEYRAGNRHTISRSLEAEIKLNLENGEQTILFLNRRGRSTYVFCRECGHVLECPNCQLPLTYHLSSQMTKQNSRLKCHHCCLTKTPPEVCPKCQGSKIKYFGAGTQKIIEDIAGLFPQARLLRMDADTTGKKDSYQQMYDALTNQEVDILIGT
ncbi:MAG TPA: primosomal protein N', partial [Candidatus Wirthbacteria bacterium]|nr:primosomal protein N' [Candidatus Wirthbacteria bacterium]